MAAHKQLELCSATQQAVQVTVDAHARALVLPTSLAYRRSAEPPGTSLSSASMNEASLSTLLLLSRTCEVGRCQQQQRVS